MNGIDFLEQIGDLDEDLIMEADRIPVQQTHKKQFASILRWGSMVAGVLVVIGFGVSMWNSRPINRVYTDAPLAFSIEEESYEVAGLLDYGRLGLAIETLDESRTVSLVPLTKKDLGEKIGALDIRIDGKICSCSVYRYAGMDEKVTTKVCVIELPGEDYRLYVEKE